jgi:tripartite-type tricarboxylate transporter receptor subunit TctC
MMLLLFNPACVCGVQGSQKRRIAVKDFNGRIKISVFILFAVYICTFMMAFEARAEYPERPISLLVSYAPGGSSDMTARVLAVDAEKILGQPIIVENRGGGGGTLALAHVANAQPDGYTICQAASTGIVRTPLLQKVPYKPLASFTPIMAYVGAHNSGLVVKSDAPWKTMREFLDYAKKNPRKVKYGTPGVGTALHHAMEFVAHQEGIEWVHVPFPGSAPAINSLLGGHVTAGSVGPELVPFAQAGSLRTLGTHEYKRSATFPDVPTFREQGFDFVNETVFSIFGPAGLPPDVVKKLETAFTKAMESPQFKAVCEKMSLIPAYYNSKDYDRFLKELWPTLEKSHKETGLIKEAATQPY